MHQSLSKYFVIFSIYIQLIAGKCPDSSESLRRVGTTRYYIMHGDKRGGFVTQKEARSQCEKHGLKLAKIRNMLTMAAVGRELEKIGFKSKLRDTWYWLDAIYDEKSERYYWGNIEDNDPVAFSNFLYRPPRPTGIGAHLNYKGIYEPHRPLTQCLTLALPWPWPENRKTEKGTIYGHHTSFDERYCESKTARHAMCESLEPECNSTVSNPFELSESQIDYFEDGNWIVGDRTYYVNWKQRSFAEASAYCEYLELDMLMPGSWEKFLIPHLKMWSRGITLSQFWTKMTFNAVKKQFFDSKGNWVANLTHGQNYERVDDSNSRSMKTDEEFCVALSLSYEFKTQMPCDNPSPMNRECTWSFIEYIPANCHNYHGVICQHPKGDKRRGDTEWKKFDWNNITPVLQQHALTNFGFKGNDKYLRSKYKQTFGHFYCGESYKMANEKDDTDFFESPEASKEDVFQVDYSESYWVMDDKEIQRAADAECTLAYGEGHKKKFKKVKCTEWHFYLCKKLENGEQKTGGHVHIKEESAVQWKEGPQQREYAKLDPVGYNTLGL